MSNHLDLETTGEELDLLINEIMSNDQTGFAEHLSKIRNLLDRAPETRKAIASCNASPDTYTCIEAAFILGLKVGYGIRNPEAV